MKVRITKAWLVEVVDENDRAIRDDWSFGTRVEAEKLGKEMLESMEVAHDNGNPGRAVSDCDVLQCGEW